jgi:hypothetical protein
MTKYEWVRWSTKEEIDQLKKWFNRNNSDDGLTWLSKNRDKVLKDHEKFINDYYNEQLNIKVENYNEFVSKIINHNETIDKITNDLKLGKKHQCICKGNLRLVAYNGGHFIGCDNYLEKVQHSSFYYKKLPEETIFDNESFFENFEYPKQYLSMIKKRYNYPGYVKASNMFEFFKLNEVTLANDLKEEMFYKIATTSKKSKDREKIVKTLLEKLFDRVGHQVHITYKEVGQKQKIKIPDFICKKEDRFYIFEQKKSIDNCDYMQLDLYIELLKIILKTENINGYFIIEEDSIENDFLPYDCFTINTLQDEFSRRSI